jgi:hypothetical protein
LNNLRQAVALQIALWDTLQLIKEGVGGDPDWVHEYVNSTAITADDGMELSHADLDDFLCRYRKSHRRQRIGGKAATNSLSRVLGEVSPLPK